MEDIFSIYNRVVEKHAKSGDKISRAVVLGDRAFNAWLDDPSVDGKELAHHLRAFVNFCDRYEPTFSTVLKELKALPASARKFVDDNIDGLGGERYRYTPDELLNDSGFLIGLDSILATNAPFTLSLSSVKEFNGVSISREYPYGAVTVTVSDSMDEFPEILSDAMWDTYHKEASEKQIQAFEHEYENGNYDYIPCFAYKKVDVTGKTAKEIVHAAQAALTVASKKLENQYDTVKSIVKAVIGE